MVYVAKTYYLRLIGDISNLKDGQFDVKLAPAIMVYFVMTLALQYFVLKTASTAMEAAVQGAFLGFCLYAVFDLTNYALLKGYPLAFVLVDMTWGTFLVGMVSFCTWYVSKML